MTGQRFGRLLVVETIYGYGKHKRKHCRCQCECGNETIVDAQSLKAGSTKSCGCLEAESRYGRRHGKYKIGDVIEGFTLIEETDRRGRNQAIIWKCQCNSCGAIIEASPSTIIKGHIESCGCSYVHPLLHDLTGQLFGLLKVESLVKRAKRKDQRYRRVVWNCKCECGNMCVVQSDMLLSGRITSCGCRTNKSARVQMIAERLSTLGITYVSEYRFADCKDKRKLPFDFYLPDINTVIEYDGEQHYKAVDFWGGRNGLEMRRMHDEIKDSYCEIHHIREIRLPYYLSNDEIIDIINKLEPVTSKSSAQ